MKPVIIIAIAFVLLIPPMNYSYSEQRTLEEIRESLSSTLPEEKKIPDWIRNIFLWYGQGEISETELLGAIQYLIENKILIVQYTGQEKISDDGDFNLVFTKTNNPLYQQYEKMFNNYDTFIGFVGILNMQYSLPYDVTINFKECGFENAYYISVNRELVMCYELIEFIFNFYYEFSEFTPPEVLLGAILFIFYHEIGHTLVDVYDLPITGMEEDAVDQFSAVTFIRLGDFGKRIVDSASIMFLEQGLKTKFVDLKFWDEHSFELQRFYNLTCLVYGSDPNSSSFLISSGLLPMERAVRCQSEYEQADKSWQVLLYPFQK